MRKSVHVYSVCLTLTSIVLLVEGGGGGKKETLTTESCVPNKCRVGNANSYLKKTESLSNNYNAPDYQI